MNTYKLTRIFIIALVVIAGHGLFASKAEARSHRSTQAAQSTQLPYGVQAYSPADTVDDFFHVLPHPVTYPYYNNTPSYISNNTTQYNQYNQYGQPIVLTPTGNYGQNNQNQNNGSQTIVLIPTDGNTNNGTDNGNNSNTNTGGDAGTGNYGNSW